VDEGRSLGPLRRTLWSALPAAGAPFDPEDRARKQLPTGVLGISHFITVL